mmetsp:Transcript_113671/g.328222  ORF Transcript_113671/g.328222 Transcript_113671/m.328222 type:complete len:234 (+) Transcript_113671:135-836(+)
MHCLQASTALQVIANEQNLRILLLSVVAAAVVDAIALRRPADAVETGVASNGGGDHADPAGCSKSPLALRLQAVPGRDGPTSSVARHAARFALAIVASRLLGGGLACRALAGRRVAPVSASGRVAVLPACAVRRRDAVEVGLHLQTSSSMQAHRRGPAQWEGASPPAWPSGKGGVVPVRRYDAEAVVGARVALREEPGERQGARAQGTLRHVQPVDADPVEVVLARRRHHSLH